jgi:hypothetical protein
MRLEGVPAVAQWLEESGELAENLLSGVKLSVADARAVLDFEVIYNPADGRLVREERVFHAVFTLDEVGGMTFRGDLGDDEQQHPGDINWSLSEVAAVSVRLSGEGAVFAAGWEGARRVEIRCGGVRVDLPDDWRWRYFGRPAGYPLDGAKKRRGRS